MPVKDNLNGGSFQLSGIKVRNQTQSECYQRSRPKAAQLETGDDLGRQPDIKPLSTKKKSPAVKTAKGNSTRLKIGQSLSWEQRPL